MSNQALTVVAFVSFVGGLMALGMVDVGPAGRLAVTDPAGETLSRLAADVAARERAFAGPWPNAIIGPSRRSCPTTPCS